MLNIDDRLIKEVLPKIKPNAFSVLLAIAIHLNKQSGRCFPSIERLCALTGLSKDTVYGSLKILRENNILESHQAIDSKTKKFGQRTFRVTTRFISIFVTAQDAEPLPENPYTAEPDTENPYTGKPETQQLNKWEQLNNDEQINKGEHAPANFEASTVEEEPLLANENTPAAAAPQKPAPADTPLTYDQRPYPKDAADLREKLRNYFTANPTQWTDGVLEMGKASKWPAQKIIDTVVNFCLHKQKTSDFQRTYHEYTADLTQWFIRQGEYDARDSAKPNAAKQSEQNTTFIPTNIPVFR